MRFKRREEPAVAGNFLRLKDGESTKGVFRGDVYEFRSKWEGGKSHVVGEDDPDGRSRFRLNFVSQEGDNFVAKIWEFPLPIYNQLADLSEDYNLSETKVRIIRNGTGTDTVYTIVPLAKEPIPAAVMKKIAAVELNILNHKPQLASQKPKNYAPGNDDEGVVPF